MASLDKWLYNFAKAQKVPRLKLTGYSRTIGATTVTSLLEDGNNHMLLCSGTSVPSGLDYFAKGCLFIKTDAAALAKAVYENVGTANSCSFNLMGEVAASDIPLTPATILVGNASSVAASVALTGDMSLDSSGVITVTSQMTSKIESQVDVNVSVTDSKITSETSRVNSVQTSEITDRGADESAISSKATSETSRVDSVITSEITDRGGDESVINSKATSETSRLDSAIASAIQDYDTMNLSNLSYLASKMVSAGYVGAVD